MNMMWRNKSGRDKGKLCAQADAPRRAIDRLAGWLAWSVALAWLFMSNGPAMATPFFQAAGTAVSGAAGVSPAWPAHAVNDIALLFVESAGGEPVTLSVPAGFAQVPNSPQATGATTAGTQITVFWARATSTTMAAPTVGDPGNHVYARIITYRGAVTSGDPWDITGGGVKAAASAAVTVTGVTTTVPDTLIVQAVARDNDSAAAAFSAQTNANLLNLVERSDAGTTSGTGGGFAVWDGVLLAAGPSGDTTATVTSSINAFLTIALKPSPPAVTSISLAGPNLTAPNTAVSWTVTFSESVTGVDAIDFALAASGVSGASITGVAGVGTTWTVTANTGTGAGMLGLNLVDNDTIVNAVSAPLGGAGTGNGDFTGPAYAVSAAPFFQAAGTAASGAAGVSPAWPAHAVNDIALLFVESAGGEPVTLSVPAGFAQVPNSPQATGATTAGTQITVFWARATSTTMAAPTVGDPGNHVYARIITYRGAVTSGDPWDITGGGVKAAASAAVTVTGVTTTVPDTLIVQAVARENDSAAAAFSAQTNANLLNLAERSDAGTASGTGGGFAVWDGVLLAAGPSDNTTATVTSSINAFLTIALKRRTYPVVVSINRSSADPTTESMLVSWAVTFSEDVTGVDASDFALAASGVSGASITGVTGAGTAWDVAANTGTGAGTLGLNLVDNDSIVDALSTPLGGAGAGNGNFTGQQYTVSPPEIGGFNACDAGATCTGATPPTYIKTKIAGVDFSLDLVALNADGTRNTAYTNTVSVELLDSSNNSGTLDANGCRNTWTTIATLSPSPTFAAPDSGLKTVGPFNVANAYRDVRVRVRKNPLVGCSSNNFAIRPNSLSFAVSDGDWETAGVARPLSNSAPGGTVHKAGRPFTITATAYNGAVTPAVTGNYAGAPTASIATHIIPASCLNGTACTVAGGSFTDGTPNDGTVSSSTATYAETGAFNMQLTDTTFADVDAADSSAAERHITSSTVTVGRFVPDHFSMTSGSRTPACTTGGAVLSYMDQPFTLAVTLEAQNFAGLRTENYDSSGGGYAPATAIWQAENADSGTDLGSRLTNVGATWAKGSYTVNSPAAVFNRNATPDGPFDNLQLGVRLSDPDGPALVGLDMNAATNDDCIILLSCTGAKVGAPVSARFGRLRLLNAYGSELLNLGIPVRAEYYDAGAWKTNAADSCTLVATSSVAIGNVQPPASSLAPTVDTFPQMSGGVSMLTLKQGATKYVGSVNVVLNLRSGTEDDQSCVLWGTIPDTTGAAMPWLQWAWCTGKLDPNARATFGVYRGAKELIYMREAY